MRFWKQTDETKLERELRAERPQPPEELVRMLSRQIAPLRRTRRLALPKVALVAAVTAALAASLGATGALGSAGGSVHAFSVSVVHFVTPAKTQVAVQRDTSNKSAGKSDNNSNAGNSGDSHSNTASEQTSRDDASPAHHPFEDQYGHRLAICWHGAIIYISPRELFWYLLHGARPPGLCLVWRTIP